MNIVSSCSLDIRDHGLLTDGAPEEAIAPPMSSPLLSRYDWEWGHQIQGCVQVGICGVATPATPESLPTPVPLLGPSTGIAPLATEGWIDPDHPDTGSGTGPLQPTDDATIGPTLLLPRTHPATPDIPEILDIELLDPIEVQLLHAPVDERVPMGLGPPKTPGTIPPPGHPPHDPREGPAMDIGRLHLAIGAVEHLRHPHIHPEDLPGLPLGDIRHLQGQVDEPPGDSDGVEDVPSPFQEGVEVPGPPDGEDDPHPVPDGVDGHPGLEGGLVVPVDREALGAQLGLDG